jgi:ribosome-associated protein
LTGDTVKTKDFIVDLARFIDDHRGIDTVVLDIGERSSFTDFFIITTVSSWTHMKGLFRELRDYLWEAGIRPLNHQKIVNEDTWVLMDCGTFVIHLMERDVREFYELEKLWFEGKKVPYSSKSSKSSPSS